MKLYEYQRSRSFIDLGPNNLGSLFLNRFSSIIADVNMHVYPQHSGERYRTNGSLVMVFIPNRLLT